jgi:hypothetical protein
MSHLYAVSQGDLTGWEHITKFGINKTIQGNALPVTIWEFGGPYNWITASHTLELLSSSASDTALGVGARTVRISGLDANFDRQMEIVTLNGVTPVSTTLSWFRINSMAVASAGTSLTNIGNITLRSPGPGLVREYIAAGKGIARSLVFTVPRNHELLLNLFAISGGGVNTTNNAVFLESRVRDNIANRVYFPAGLKINLSSAMPYHHMADPPVYYGEMTDYSWECTESSVNAARAAAVYFSASLVNKEIHGNLDTSEHPRW